MAAADITSPEDHGLPPGLSFSAKIGESLGSRVFHAQTLGAGLVTGDKDAEPKSSEYVVCSLFEGQYVDAVVAASKDRASGRGVEIDLIKILGSGELPPPLLRAWWQFWKR